MKKSYIEFVFLISTNLIFYFISLSVQELVKEDYLRNCVLSGKNLATIIFIVLCMTLLVICMEILIFKRYSKIGILSVYTIIITAFWDILLVATMDYSLSWNSFMKAEGIVISAFYILPIVFVVTTFVYKMKTK